MPRVNPLPRAGARTALLAFLSMALGSLVALLFAEGVFRALGLKEPEPGRIFRISNGGDLQYPGRAGHTVIDLYSSNPRGAFPIDLNDENTRVRLAAENFTRIDEARRTNPFGVALRFNTRGFRDREFAPRAPSTKRVVFVGDSFTEAQGVEESASAVRLVESSLGRNHGLVETWNLGVRGQDFPGLEALFDQALELAPDVVIFGMVLNDGDRDAELTRHWPRVNDWIMVRQDAPSWLERHSHFAGFVAARYNLFRISRDTTAWYRALYSDANRDGWMRTRAALLRIQKKCRERGVSLGVALWPLLVGLERGGNYPFESTHAQIKKGVERSGIPFRDLLPTLRGRDSSSLWVHPSDLHPNEIAQRLVAPALTEFAHLRLLEAANRQPVAK